MANPAMAADYLFMQGVIAQRIEELVQQVKARGIDALAQATEAEVREPTAYVLWEGERFPDQRGDGTSVMVEQRFSVLLAVRNASQADKDARNGLAGPLLSKLHQALAGWKPEAAQRPLKRTNGRPPIYLPNTGLYPLTFAILLNL